MLALGAHAQTTVVSLQPAAKTVLFGASFDLTLNISPAAPPGGVTVDLHVNGTNLLTSATVTVLEGMTSASFVVVAGFSAGQSTVTATIGGSSAIAVVDVVQNALVPGAPFIGAATPGGAQASIAFSPPASDGGSPITSYTATCQPGGFAASGASSPIVVGGLTNGITYSCSVAASNIAGTGPSSPAVPVTPVGVAARRFDFDGDGKADILWRHSGSGANYLYLMNETTIVAEGYLRTVVDQAWQIAGVGDFDGDGKVDILWRHAGTGENYLYFMDGAAIKPSEGYLRTVASQDWQVAGIGDFNGDGKDDILWRNRVTGENYLFLLNALAIASEGYLRTVANLDWRIAGVGDFDGNGHADVLWRNAATGENYVFLMNGLSVSNEGYVRTVANLDWGIAGVADFDGDGRSDILWRNTTSGENYLYLMQGIEIAGEGYVRTVASAAWEIKGAADFDGDGNADVLWRNSATGENYLFFMNGLAIANEGYVRAVADTNWRIAPGAIAPVSKLVRFVAMGATGEGNAGQQQVANAVRDKCAASGCDFVQLLGDNFYDSGVASTSDPQWNTKFEAPYADINLPFYAVLGNNDYGLSTPEAAKGQYQVDYSAVSAKWRMPAKYYRHRVQHVEFFALDSTMQQWLQDAAQRTDVAGWIAASTATWKIAFGHHTYRSNGLHGNAGSYDNLPFIQITNGAGVKSFMDTVVCGSGKADVHFSAFDHSLQWLQQTCAGTELIVSGAGSKLSELPGSQPRHFQTLTLGFVYVTIDGNTLTAEFISSAGALLYTRTITKP